MGCTHPALFLAGTDPPRFTNLQATSSHNPATPLPPPHIVPGRSSRHHNTSLLSPANQTTRGEDAPERSQRGQRNDRQVAVVCGRVFFRVESPAVCFAQRSALADLGRFFDKVLPSVACTALKRHTLLCVARASPTCMCQRPPSLCLRWRVPLLLCPLFEIRIQADFKSRPRHHHPKITNSTHSSIMPVSALKESDLLNRKGSFSEEGVLGLKDMALVSHNASMNPRDTPAHNPTAAPL